MHLLVARAPFPGEAALAARMGKSVRTIQGYLRSLEAKGLLHIEMRHSPHGQQQTNAYDLWPFFQAIEGLARLDGLLPDEAAASVTDDETTSAAPHARPRDNDGHGHDACPRGDRGDTDACILGPCDQHNADRGGAEQGTLCAGASRAGADNRPPDDGPATTERGEGSRGGAKNPAPQVNPVETKTFDLDSIPPTLAAAKPGNARPGTEISIRDEGPGLPAAAADPTPPAAPDSEALAAQLGTEGAELGDDAPASSITRAANLRRDADVSLDCFMALLDEAAARTRARQASIVKRRRAGHAPNGMPYLFAVLQDLVHPAAPRTCDAGPDTDGRRSGPADRRRRRRAARGGAPAHSYAAWSDSPAPLPIVEEHPVWHAVLAELAQDMTTENFNGWLAPTHALGQEGELLRVAVPAPFTKQWLEAKLHGRIRGALERRGYGAWRVEYVVAAA